MIATILGFFASSPLMRKIALYGAIALAVILFYFGWKRKIENIGEQKVRLENAHAQAVIAKKILAAPVPMSRDDTAKLLDKGGF
jgi:phosphate/sulfate permease